MQTHTTTADNTAALIEEFLDGFNLPVHRDGDTLHVRDDNETEVKLADNSTLEEIQNTVLGIVGNTEENQEDWKMLLDRWDFAA